MPEERYPKQVIVVRKDLNMRKGKIAAQVAHASIGVLLDQMSTEINEEGDIERTLLISPGSALDQWINGIFTKICVYVRSEEELTGLHEKAKALGIPCKLITDCGKTEFHGEPTLTVLSVGPDWNDQVDLVTSGLPLL